MKYIFNVVAIIALVFFVIWAVNFKKTDSYEALKGKISQPVDFLKKGVEIFKYNLDFETSPKRETPTTTIKKEVLLSNFVGQVFGSFSREDWEEFWNLIYGSVNDKEGFYSRKRYRTKEEIETYLLGAHPSAFSNFKDSHWNYFWEIIFGTT